MKLAKNTDLVLTIVYLIAAVFLLLLTFLLLGGGEALFDMVGGMSDGDLDPNSPSAGYELLARMFGGFAGVMIGIFGFLFGIITGIAFLILTIVTIVACSRRKQYTATGNPIYIKKNLTAKMVINSIVLALLIAIVLLDFELGVFLSALVLAALEVFLIKVGKLVS